MHDLQPGAGRRTDYFLAGLAMLLALALFCLTLAPSVEAGDIAELQYAPARLAIPHPNGYPLYMLLGWLWSWLPLGSLAWRMNLLSAVLGALCVGATYGLARAAGLRRAPALVAALAWTVDRTFWYWSGVADRYSLWMLLGVALLASMLLWRRTGRPALLLLAGLLLGLALATHVASPLFALPGLILLLWPGRAARPRLIWAALGLVVLPLLLYLYLPLRGAAWETGTQVDPIFHVADSVLRGLVHPRYSQTAWWQYPLTGIPLNAKEIFANATGNAAWFMPALIRNQFGTLWLALAGLGLVLALRRFPAWGIALFVLFVSDVALALHYLQGNEGAYFLPAALVVVLALAELANGFQQLAERMPGQPFVRLAAAAVFLLLPLVFARDHSPTAAHKQSYDLDAYWRRVLALPLEKNAGLIAHWSDLTPLWYFQQGEKLRPDLAGLYLPDSTEVQTAVNGGQAIYLAAPLAGWYQDLPWRVQLVPWGPLVRLAPNNTTPAMLAAGTERAVRFGDEVVLRGVSLPTEAVAAGSATPITLTWQTLTALPRDTHVSLRLVDGQRLVAQQDDRLVSPWFPIANLTPNLQFWSQHQLRLPAGLRPGDYALKAVVYHLDGPELRPDSREAETLLGTLRIRKSAPTGTSWLPRLMLGPCLALTGQEPVVQTVTAGSVWEFERLWLALCVPPSDLALRISARQDGRGSPAWILDTVPLAELAPPDGWEAGQTVRVPLAMRLPGDMEPGLYNLEASIVDLRQDRVVPRGFGALPLPGATYLGTLDVTVRPHTIEAPAMEHVVATTFGPITLLGYNSAAEIRAGQPVSVTLAWRANQAIQTSYTVFLHLLAPDGHIVAQRDTLPRAGALPTNAWLPGEVVVDGYTLNPGEPLQPGVYTLIAGLYDAQTMQRARVTAGSETALNVDRVTLGTLSVTP